MLLVAFAAAAVLAQAAAQTAPPADPSAAARPPTDVAPVTVEGKPQDPLVCKMSQPLGSKVPKRTCMRKTEIEEARVEGRRVAEDLQRTTEPFFRPKEP